MSADRPCQLPHRFARPRFTAIGLAAWLGTAGGICLVEGTIAPQVVQAYTTRVDVALDRLPNESYDALIRRSEIVARAAAQRSFDRDILTSQVSVIVIGRNQGAETPILTLDVSRVQWSSRPDTRRWATYYKTSAALLGFEQLSPVPVTVTAPPTPAVAPVAPTQVQPSRNTTPSQQTTPTPPTQEDGVPPEDQQP
ncbi:hypothetical protein C7B65_11370 [Phormidesmis priestleyi ULC007]|uniref:Uncharacterized protein n=1 Tax=Phormidesmis priestleyi ULC007 TaxID=1920490 RepID=A0A2T1DG78_9CYAN|nr:hypothetical protein [Phormidesmis priestleyi]PSB19510.1 hypothetical protein C7B65_11370 [Phormidesmis priestleyi ULC007]PZO53050.1 MAG: hypothetical protein DCF14_05385 [Phormidesmis priestleyi]